MSELKLELTPSPHVLTRWITNAHFPFTQKFFSDYYFHAETAVASATRAVLLRTQSPDHTRNKVHVRQLQWAPTLNANPMQSRVLTSAHISNSKMVNRPTATAHHHASRVYDVAGLGDSSIASGGS